MAIDPPYRLDPLQNPVNVKWRDEGEPTSGTFEGFASVSISAVWVFSPGNSVVNFSDGPGTLRVKIIGSVGLGTEVAGVWSGGSGSGSEFTNDGDGIFFPTPGGGLSGSFHVNNFVGTNKGGDGDYSFDGLTFVQTAGGRIYTVAGTTTDPVYDLSAATSIPRVVSLVWSIRMIA